MSGHASGGAWALERVCCIKQEEGENSNRTTRGAQEQCNAGNIYMSHARCVFHKLWEGALLVPGWSEVHGGKIKKKVGPRPNSTKLPSHELSGLKIQVQIWITVRVHVHAHGKYTHTHICIWIYFPTVSLYYIYALMHKLYISAYE